MVQMKKAWALAAAALISAGLAVTAAGAEYDGERASSFSSRFYLDNGDDSSEDKNGSYDHTKDKEAQLDTAHGPGAALLQDNAQTATGPTIQEVTMREQRHEEYGLYEESIDGKFFLYSNVSNGGVTDESAYLEIPAGLDYRMEKDGVPFPYTSGQRVADKGTYVVYITAVEDRNVPLSQQTEYRTVFRFRIDEKLTEFKDTMGNGLAAAGEAAGNLAGLPEGYVSGGLEALLDAGNRGDTPTEATEAEESHADDGTEDNAPDGDGMNSGTAGESGDGSADKTADDGSDKDGNEAKEVFSQSGQRSQTYQPEDSMYRVVLEDGNAFLISVPENMVTTQSVTYKAEGDCTLTLDGEALDPETDSDSVARLRAFGKYNVVSGGYEYPFEITDIYTNRSVYTAPVGMKITKAAFDEKPLDTGDGREVSMAEDGDYEFILEGEDGQEETVELTRDSMQPEISVDVGRQSAAITYIADDIAGITLSKNGEEPKNFSGVEVKSPGRYVLTVTDRAGNVTVSEFSLRYHMNFYALFAVILCVAGIAAAVVVLIRKKKNLTVR